MYIQNIYIYITGDKIIVLAQTPIEKNNKCK